MPSRAAAWGLRRPHRPPEDLDRARRRAGDADDRLGDLGAPRTDEPGEADDLALADREGDILEVPRQRQVLHLQRRLPEPARLPRCGRGKSRPIILLTSQS